MVKIMDLEIFTDLHVFSSTSYVTVGSGMPSVCSTYVFMYVCAPS
jgi:hypothetical protein